jgi:HSP20 family protein
MNKGIIVFKDQKLSFEELLSKEKSVIPEANIFETVDDYFLVVNMPGVSRDNITLKIQDTQLMVFGRIDYNDVMNRKYILKETEKGNYYRSFKISESIEHQNIEARYENGQLTLKLPKKENLKSRTITIL